MEVPLPTSDNFWLTLLVFILFGSPALFSKAAAKLPGIFGAAGRWWQGRSTASRNTSRVITATNLDRIIEERVSEKIGHVEKELDELREDVDDYAEYLTYDAGWHREINIYAAQEGFAFPPPLHMTFTQWQERKRALRAGITP
ncbi:membrane protein [Gordonia phage Bonum]|uniref:Minor tail protein n=2 Tax=Kablunavirus TaxID=2948776 RepID=A0A2D1GCM4_9CAUD|nr:hypothetical protein KNT75_gp55 [Gordonia phage Kabluna]YP_010101179.1 hypothetical protein KNU46_gp55 [Gordonia phage NosilaM]ATN89576.1 hypothetical protein SEA_KABLUNA_55 [Gordonia phage Kabluna]QAU07298.1 hypothetical protein SEA_NOSILAM_55 [Gordonia phage NosilaM]QXN73360.1 membrane protein [Gordonia phage Bonum]